MNPVRSPFTLTLFLVLGGLTSPTATAWADVRVQVSEISEAKTLASPGHPESVMSLVPGTPTRIDLSSPVEITSVSRIPLILFPLQGSNSLVTLEAPKLQDIVNRLTDEQLDHALSIVLGRLADVQNLIHQRKLSDALQELNSLQAQHPSAKFLEFTRASILLLQGDRIEALRIAEFALKSVPDYREGQAFVKKLRGENP